MKALTLIQPTRERGIPFMGEMVCKLLADEKRQTRRLVKLRDFCPSTTRGYDWAHRDKRGVWNEYSTTDLIAKRCPYGVVGDRLYVRERLSLGDDDVWRYAADNSKIVIPRDDHPRVLAMRAWVHHTERRYAPSIHMPRWASRITLALTDVRVERLADISEADAKAEGVDPTEWSGGPANESARGAFRELWDSLNAKRAPWESNPWVWVLDFKRIESATHAALTNKKAVGNG